MNVIWGAKTWKYEKRFKLCFGKQRLGVMKGDKYCRGKSKELYINTVLLWQL